MTGHRLETGALWLAGIAAAGLLVHVGAGPRNATTAHTAPDSARSAAIAEDDPRWNCWQDGNRVCGFVPGPGQDADALARHAVAAGPPGATCWVAPDAATGKRVLCTVMFSP